jgi:hypothetical protein
VILFLVTRRLFPEAGTLPEFTTPRKQIDGGKAGVTPFTLVQSNTVQYPPPAVAVTTHARFPTSRFSVITTNSVRSVNSQMLYHLAK